jgi:hypothetical protein
VNIQSLITNPSVGEPFLFRGNRRLVLPLARRPEIGEVHASKAMDVLGFISPLLGILVVKKWNSENCHL